MIISYVYPISMKWHLCLCHVPLVGQVAQKDVAVSQWKNNRKFLTIGNYSPRVIIRACGIRI